MDTSVQTPMSVQEIHVMNMQTVIIMTVATSVSAGQVSGEMDTTV
jgi:hypothetical protein